jgi:hypothetical protein
LSLALKELLLQLLLQKLQSQVVVDLVHQELQGAR